MVPGGSGSANPLIQQLKSDGQILFNRLLSIEGIVSQVIIFMNLKIQGNTRHHKYTKGEVGVILDIIWQQISGNADMKRFSTVLIKSFPMLKHEV